MFALLKKLVSPFTGSTHSLLPQTRADLAVSDSEYALVTRATEILETHSELPDEELVSLIRAAGDSEAHAWICVEFIPLAYARAWAGREGVRSMDTYRRANESILVPIVSESVFRIAYYEAHQAMARNASDEKFLAIAKRSSLYPAAKKLLDAGRSANSRMSPTILPRVVA